MKVVATRSYPKADDIRTRGNQVFSVVRQKWVQLTPEERVRQEYLRVLSGEYGYTTDQIVEEYEVTGRGAGKARADFVIWRSVHTFHKRTPAEPVPWERKDTSGNRVHFDLAAFRYVAYDNPLHLRDLLKAELESLFESSPPAAP